MWNNITIKGVNIGTSLPGSWYTEFPADRDLYKNWFESIAGMNANTIRVYTLLDPSFYAVLNEHNADPNNETLWLFQEIWPHDEVPGLNLHDQLYRNNYLLEIELTLDALHGNADIPARPYRAYGNYSTDVSPYLIGLMIGRELEPEEVQATDSLNPGLTPFYGDYVQTAPGASPTEIWLAEMCDYAAAYSAANYNKQYPVGFVSWPTLDPLTHLTEWDADGKPGYNDREVVDPNIFSPGPENKAGFFGAYHIYPNYPDFMNNEPGFAQYSDDDGVFRYKGYLDNFMAIHPAYPALVAEFGISTSLNTAHLSPDGLHHGGLSEVEQGEMVVRMMRSIIDEGYAGGVIFEWSDEWAKKTWNTEPFMVPWERQVLWQNAMCPEQNYGLLAVEPLHQLPEELLSDWHRSPETMSYKPVDGMHQSFGQIKLLETGADEAFLYLALTLSEETVGMDNDVPWSQVGLSVGIDIGVPGAGLSELPVQGLPELPAKIQFMLEINSPEEALLLTIPSYNRGRLNFFPEQDPANFFEPIETLVNRERTTVEGLYFPALYSNESILRYGNFDSARADYNSLAHWHVDDNGRVMIRLPWMLLNVADPSAGSILLDSNEFLEPPLRDVLKVVQSDGIRLYAATFSKQEEPFAAEGPGKSEMVIDFIPRLEDSFNYNVDAYRWKNWEEPQYQFRLKESYQIIADYFDTIR